MLTAAAVVEQPQSTRVSPTILSYPHLACLGLCCALGGETNVGKSIIRCTWSTALVASPALYWCPSTDLPLYCCTNQCRGGNNAPTLTFRSGVAAQRTWPRCPRSQREVVKPLSSCGPAITAAAVPDECMYVQDSFRAFEEKQMTVPPAKKILGDLRFCDTLGCRIFFSEFPMRISEIWDGQQN